MKRRLSSLCLRNALRVLCIPALFLAMLMPGCAARDAEPRTDLAMISQSTPTGFLFDAVDVAGVTRSFAVYVPRDYTAQKQWPVIVFLNGAGECGTDGQKHIAVGLAPAMMLDAASWPFIVVFPQKPTLKSSWLDHDALVLACLDKTLEAYSTDRSRVYLTGLSQGGNGTWEIGARHASRFAAVAPICGWGRDPAALALGLKETPVWAFHGEKDTAVPPDGTRKMATALEALGAKPKTTFYPDLGHNSWDKAYRDEKLGAWLLEHRRETK